MTFCSSNSRWSSIGRTNEFTTLNVESTTKSIVEPRSLARTGTLAYLCRFTPCFNTIAEKSRIDNFFPEVVRPKAAEIGPKILDTFSKANKYGVKIAFGTDSGVSAHGDNWQEFVLMVKGGMTPIEAIRSATLETAKLFRLENEIGKIKTGFSADIIALRDNPLENIESLKDISFVMKEGTRYK